MKVKSLIRSFCEANSDKYSVCESYANDMLDKPCMGIVVKEGFSYMEMLMELTEYMDKADLEGDDLMFSDGMLIEEYGTDVIACFPNCQC